MRLNNSPIMEGQLFLPASGAWSAELSVDAETAPTGRVTIELDGSTYFGTVVRSGMRNGHARALVVGGNGGLAKLAKAKSYDSSPARIVVSDLLEAGGEQLASEADAALLNSMLSQWLVPGWRVSSGLDSLCAHLDATWRIQSDGNLWLGRLSWPTLQLEHEVTDSDPAAGWVELWTEKFRLRPGVTFAGQKVGAVQYRLSPHQLRTRFWEAK